MRGSVTGLLRGVEGVQERAGEQLTVLSGPRPTSSMNGPQTSIE